MYIMDLTTWAVVAAGVGAGVAGGLGVVAGWLPLATWADRSSTLASRMMFCCLNNATICSKLVWLSLNPNISLSTASRRDGNFDSWYVTAAVNK
jgi:hypothetical protein